MEVDWKCLLRADNVSHELVRMMKRSGCSYVCIGAESGNDNILARTNKKITTHNIEEAVKALKSEDITVELTFILGLPGETVESMQETLDFVEKVSPDFCWVGLLTPLPGSAIFNNPEEYDIQVLTRDWGKYNMQIPVALPYGMTKSELAAGFLDALSRFSQIAHRGRKMKEQGGLP